MKILGINSALEWDPTDVGNNARGHDAGVTLFVDGKHVLSTDEERHSRIKYDGGFPKGSIDYCLGDIPKEDIDIVCYVPSCIKFCHEQTASGQAYNFLQGMFPNAKIWYVGHHLCHAASAVFTAPFNSGSFLTLDGVGSGVWNFASAQVITNENNGIGYFDKNKREFRFFRLNSHTGMNSLGEMFGFYSSNIYDEKINGVKPIPNNPNPILFQVEGKVMGLSAYGDVNVNPGVPYCKSTEYSKETMGVDKFLFGEPSVSYYNYDMVCSQLKGTPEDKAAFLQHHYEGALTYLIKELREDYLTEDVCFAGGCFLNVCANTLLQPYFRNIHIPPWPNDSGVHFGAAVYASYKCKETIEIPNNIALLGKSYEDYVPMEENCEHFEDFDLLCEIVAKAIDENKIIGWFQGRSEHGPRALGSRSILMSPSKKENKDIINSRVKHREYWRPFAGVVLEDYVGEYFEEGFNTPYMLFSQTAKSDKIPAITHEDKTCRIQTVNDELNPRLCQLLRKFEDPILLNTSFNDNGEPIVETPDDAIRSFKKMDLDYLVIGNYLLWK